MNKIEDEGRDGYAEVYGSKGFRAEEGRKWRSSLDFEIELARLAHRPRLAEYKEET